MGINIEINQDIIALIYLLATICFILGLKGLSSPKTALPGNYSAMIGMSIAIIATSLHPDVKSFQWIIYGLLLGAFIGIAIALKIKMTAMPQLVAALHSFVGLSAVLIAIGTFLNYQNDNNLNPVLLIELSLGSVIGAITFTGSIIAFGKLQGILKSNPVIFKGQHLLNLILIISIIILCIYTTLNFDFTTFIILSVLSLIIGILIIIPIGGADMPVVVSMLNSYSGWAAAATGFTLNNNLLITTGALVGSSGAILSYIMCKAMNRSFISVILGGFGGESGDSTLDQSVAKGVKSASAEDAAFMLENSSKIIIVPGYGMAVAQAQHALKELWQILSEKEVETKFAIHPVAGRMPGHMNVLLAESDIPYDVVEEMEQINGEFASTDVVLVVGANDIVNPDAKNNKSSPLYGMPILDTYKAKHVFICKRSLKPGYAGVDNSLFYYDNCSLIFGDAKASIEKIIENLK